MTSRYSNSVSLKAVAATLVLLLSAGGVGRGQAAALAGEIASDPAAAPAVARSNETTNGAYGPEKPSANRALRDALSRANAQPLAGNQRAVLRAVDAFYAERGDAPLFFDKGQWTAQARGAFEQLQKAPDDGLDLRGWRVYSLDPAAEASLAIGEVALAQAVAAYAFQASGGRIEPLRISKAVGVHPPVVSAAQALQEISTAPDAAGKLASYNPVHPGYLALRDKLAKLRAKPASNLLAASEHGRRSSDAASNRAPAATAARKAALESELLVNMEFWRWLPRDLGNDRILVNIPEFMARLYRGEAVAAANRIVVGKPDKPTPLFSDRMQYLIVNPSWYVPQSIIRNEMMGKLDALRAQGYEISTVHGQLRVRQPPGERNALGRIKFIFPNDYAVYMHDTPSRRLFAERQRAFSHGCMRVDEPLKWAVAILGAENGWSEKRIEKMYGKSERRVTLPKPLPIHVGYFTVTVEGTGELRRFDDVYGYAAETKKLLGLGG
jgi:murein L,D-transpeptidase YcbB/YkuD